MFIEAHVISPADGRTVPLENKLCSLQLEWLVFILCFLASLLLSLKVKFLNTAHKSNSELSYILCLVFVVHSHGNTHRQSLCLPSGWTQWASQCSLYLLICLFPVINRNSSQQRWRAAKWTSRWYTSSKRESQQNF